MHRLLKNSGLILGVFLTVLTACTTKRTPNEPLQISGIYPHLAMYNKEGECGTGAVVPWAGRLWAMTYGPHLPFGSSDKLYEITPDLQQIIRAESIGGTPANRMIHPESGQLFMGPYAIDSSGNVRAVPYEKMPGRLTGNARHLTDPINKIYYGSMEEGFYEVDVKTLEPKWLYADENLKEDQQRGVAKADLIGWHGKGLYSGQGVLVYSNNGERGEKALRHFDAPSGGLHEWDGQHWKLIRRNQFTEVTGPGGIYGNENAATDPIWTTGWDHKSILVGVRGDGKWKFYRLPKVSHSYDGAHGWNTEWPRIRNIGTAEEPDYLMTMHGLFWTFPSDFSIHHAAGIRPRSAYLKVIGDFTRWNDQLVFGCDDSAEKEFLNKRKAKGNIEGPGQSNSNLWFTSIDKPDLLGPNTAEGSIWLREEVKANERSEPFLFTGWDQRSCWISNEGNAPLILSFEIDEKGDDHWKPLKEIKVAPGEAINHVFSAEQKGEWIRLYTHQTGRITVHFVYGAPDNRKNKADDLFDGLSEGKNMDGGLLYSLGNDQKTLGMLAMRYNQGVGKKIGYYELNERMELIGKENDSTVQFIEQKFAIPQQVVTIDTSSVLIVDDAGRRWRLPLADDTLFTDLTNKAALRICREVATERDLFNCHGTFYELPAENADGYAKIRPISSHHFKINDYASYRGMLIMTGIDLDKLDAIDHEHIFVSNDRKAAIWAGVIDDLWKLGKPRGHGGPWKNAPVKQGVPSDPYLIGFYDQRHLELSHKAWEDVTFTLEIDPGGEGNWMEYKKITVKPNETVNFNFPVSFQARWLRFKSNVDCVATTWLTYK